VIGGGAWTRWMRWSAPAIAAALVAAPTAALPVREDLAGHYLVVRLDADGRPEPVFHRRVALDGDRAVASAGALALARANPDQLVVEAEGWRTVVDVPRFVRGEFAANGVDGAIESRVAPDVERAFVVRVPAGVDGELTLSNLGRETTLDLAVVEREAALLPIPAIPEADAQSASGDGRGTASGPSSNRVDVLVMGDGYTASEAATFATDVENMRVAMFGFSPYREYASFVNWTSLFTASAQSGADHPPYQAGCTTTSCCAETAAQTDPRANTFVNTAFDGRFCTSQIHRLVTVSNSKVLAAASASPNWDEIIVLVNDPVYGGAGGSISVTTTNTSARLIVVHEYGHTFHRLADEYTTAYPGFPACSDISGTRACEANVTDQTVAGSIKWASWITPGNAIPTPAGTSGIGLFVGARYQTTGMHRPANNCAMRSLGGQFCSVCSQEYVLRLYRGGWGAPSAGIDLIEPGSESPSNATTVNVAAGGSQVFSASVLRPQPDSVSLQWYVDGVAVNGANGTSFTFQPGTGGPATRQVELRATDTTAMVRAAMAGTDLVHRRTWNVQVGPPGVVWLSVGNASVREGDVTLSRMGVAVDLSQPAPPGGVSVSMRAINGSATAGEDYDASSVTVVIPQGESRGSFDFVVYGDTLEENDEQFHVIASAPTNARLADAEGLIRILNDDGNGVPSLAARNDRFVLMVGTTQAILPSLDNDEFNPGSLLGGALSIVRAPVNGSASISAGELSGDASDDRISYSPTSPVREDSLRYRLCDFGGRCSEAEVQILRRPVAESMVAPIAARDRGLHDIELSGLSALPSARFDAHGLVAPALVSPSLTADTTPETPFDAGGTSTTLRTFAAGPSARTWRVFVDAISLSGGDVDVYLGLDANNNGQADSNEVACSSAMSAVSERCELAVSQAANTPSRYWVLLHLRSGAQNARAELFEVPVDRPLAQRQLVATGPGAVAANAEFAMRLIWNDATMAPGQVRGGWLEVKSDANTSLGWVPVRIERGAGAAVPFALQSGIDHAMALADSAANEGLYIDVPPGTTRLDATTTSATNVDMYLARIDTPAASSATPSVPSAPARNLASASAVTPTGDESLTVNNPAAGRWYVTPVNAAGTTADLTVRATLTGTGPQLRPGGFYNPQRSGNGLFLYPAGSEWAGLWYTYLQDGTPTWYYLQAPAPGATGIWRGTIYRSAWNGSSNFLTPVGEATVTPRSTSAFTFSYTLDGETGSEAYENFGGGCPTFAGAPLNASGHWFDPARAGSGYSVQLFPNYEFYTVFGYDAQGVPRYLIAERSGIGTATQSMSLDQNTGACPLCTRTGNPVRNSVGTLTRTVGSGTLQRIQLTGTYTAGVAGTWAANDAVTPLGTLQGCAGN
jgi:hypothetical protein